MFIPSKLLSYLLYFSAMAFVGWIIETVYRSWEEKRFVNAGFLSGPFVPIYGFAAVIITVISEEVKGLNPFIAWAVILISPTIVEYIGGVIMENVFKLKLWNYQNERFNVQGRICLKFSIYWAILAALLVLVINPLIYRQISDLGPYLSYFLAGGLLANFIADINHSVKSLLNFKEFQNNIDTLIERGRQFHSTFEELFDKNNQIKLPVEIRRILKPLNAFPNLRRNFRKKMSVFPDNIKKYLNAKFPFNKTKEK